MRYVLLADGINAEELLKDMDAMEKEAYDALIKTPEEQSLVSRSRQTDLTVKLADFASTPPEWKEYKSLTADDKTSDRTTFESFYKEAQARDRSMANNMMIALTTPNRPKEAGKENPPVAILVTGGFHAEGMAKHLTAQGATVISYVPKIEKVDTAQGSTSLSVFTPKKDPEKLFQGEKLFLAANPAKRSLLKTLAPAMVVLSTLALGSVVSGVDANALYQTLGGWGILIGATFSQNILRGTVFGKSEKVDVQSLLTENESKRSPKPSGKRPTKIFWHLRPSDLDDSLARPHAGPFSWDAFTNVGRGVRIAPRFAGRCINSISSSFVIPINPPPKRRFE